jgi:hypothetical protein
MLIAGALSCAAPFVMPAGARDGAAVPGKAPEEVRISTPSAGPRADDNRLLFNIEKDRYDSRVGLDYSLRWDFSDLKNLRPDRLLFGGIAAAAKWDITDNTRLKYYGFTTNPWRILIAREQVGGAGAASASPAAGVAARPQYRKHVRLSFSPLVDDVKRDLDENVRNLLLDGSLNKLSPEWRRVPRREKKGFFQDVLSLDIWGVPGLDETRKGLDYISK